MPNLPSTEQVMTEHNWIGSATITNILKPTIDSKEYKIWGNQNITGLFDMLAGAKNPVSGLKYMHYEDNRLHTVVSATGTASGSTALVTFTVVAPYLVNPYPAAAVSPYLTTGPTTTLIPVRLGDTLEFPGNIMGTVIGVGTTDGTAPGAGKFDAIPDSQTVFLPTTIGTDEIIIRGVTKGEGANTTTKSMNFTLSEYSNVMEIKVNAVEYTGSASVDGTWVEFEKDGGQMVYLWYYKNQSDCKIEVENIREVALVSGKQVTNTSTLATFDPTLLKTQGLDDAVLSGGQNATYNIVAGMSLDEWDDIIIDDLDKNKGMTENSVWASIRFRKSVDGFIRPEMKNGAISYGMFEGDAKKYIALGFNQFEHLGYTMDLKTYDLFNNPTWLGATGSKWLNYGWIIPANREMYAIGESKEKVDVPSMRMNYASQGPAGGPGSREMQEWLTGGTGPVFNNEADRVKLNYRMHFGFEIFGAKNFVAVRGI